jgi:HD-GYP domain-containing protein (c-di-GMP phosphodiesterase class II)
MEWTMTAGSTLLGTCFACSTPLPLRLPEVGEESRAWECCGCGAVYHGVLLEEWPIEFRAGVRPVSSSSGDGLTPELADWCGPPQRDPISIALPGRPPIQCDLATPLSREYDAQIECGTSLRLAPQGERFAERVRRQGDRPYDKEVMNRLARLLNRSFEQLRDVFTSLKTGSLTGMHVVESISRDGLLRATEDLDLFVYLGITPSSTGYPSRHSLRVAMLAMAMGMADGWDEKTLLELGTGCLVHDVGMLRLDPAIYESKRILSPSDFAQITAHPVLAVDLLGQHRLTLASRMVVYQLHERCDGSGYPRGYTANRIHQLAKFAAVADVYVALVCPRPHRPGMVPHHALKKILSDTKAGLYEADAVRALLRTVSLFPIGSHVALSDGRVGKVLRCNTMDYDRPIIEAWSRGDPAATRTILDLSDQQDVQITSTLAHPS